MGLNGILKNNSIRTLLILTVLALFFSCEEEKKKGPTLSKPKKKKIAISRPEFNADSAYAFIAKQVAFGPRVPNTEAHVMAGNYLSSKLQSYGFEMIEQKAVVKAYDGKKLNMKNIIGQHKKHLNNRILLFAHWDSRPIADQDDEDRDQAIDGANDGASGVGILLEVARQIQAKDPEIGIDIIFFDAEDYGQPIDAPGKRLPGTWCLGSQYFAKNPHRANYSANFGILLDMVGAKHATFTKEAISRYYAAPVVDKVWDIAASLGHSDYFVPQETTHVGDDDHVYINKFLKIPSIDIIQYYSPTGGFAPHWHTHDDTMDIIDKNTLTAVGETVLATVFQEAP